MENTRAVVDDLRLIQEAAGFDSTNLMGSLSQLIGYRQRIAQTMLRTNSDEEHHELKQAFEYTQSKIKLLLAI